MQRIISEFSRVIHTIGTPTWKRLFIGFIVFVLPIILFVELADEVFEKDTLVVDEAILRHVYSWSNPSLDAFVVATTDLGYVWWVGLITIIILLLCIKHRQYTSALIALVGVAGSALINLLLKLIFQRDRPQLWERLVTENSYSFPSGHAMASASLAVVLIVLLWPTKWRPLAVLVGLAYMLYVGFTRLYLGVHYPSDILAGWLVAGAWVGITVIIITKLRRTTS